jgi:hypothetical protein
VSRELATKLSTELRDVLEPLLREVESLNERIQDLHDSWRPFVVRIANHA